MNHGNARGAAVTLLLKYSSPMIDELKIKRNSGIMTPDVIKMCETHLDEMAEMAARYLKKKSNEDYDFSEVVAAIKKQPQLLVDISKFEDLYEEVLKWNKLIRTKQLDFSATASHRELDIAIWHKLQEDVYAARIDPLVYKILYIYPRSKQI